MTADKTVLLHLGPPKTGTTSIQAFLDRASDALAERGVHYAKSGRLREGEDVWVNRRTGRSRKRAPTDAHHMLAWSMMGEAEGVTEDACWGSLVDEIKRTPAPVILVSSEDLCRLRLKDVKRACRFLEEFNVRAVSYLRDPFERMHSDYTQRLRAGRYYPSFAEFIDAEQHLLVNYDDFVGFWDECIGEENVTIRSFENVRQSGGLEMDFASLLIEDYNSLSEFVSQKRLNSSPNPGASDRLRLVNRIEHALGRPSWMRRGFSGIRRLAGGNGIAAGLIGTCTSPERSNPAEERQQVGELSATSYERLARRAERHPAPLRPGAG